MTNYRYLIILIAIMLSIFFRDNHVVGQQVKSKFRPRPEWINPSGISIDDLRSSDSVAYDEQSDQPETLNFSPFQGFFDSFVFTDIHEKEGSNKFQRTAGLGRQHERFVNLCPTNQQRTHISSHRLYDDAYEYKPEWYMEVKCVEPYHPLSRITASSVNKICEQHDNKCIQLEKTHFFIKRLRTRFGEKNNNCWEPAPLNISSDCSCLWPERRKDYYDKIYS